MQIAAIVAVSILALIGVVGYFAIPAAARWGIETVGSRELGRTVRVESISANPYALRVTVKGLTVEGLPGEPAPLLTLQQATVNASISSVLRFAPVIDALKIDGLTANIVRLEAQRFNFDDIIERLRAKPKKDDDKPAGFAVGNIEIAGSLVNFDDRVTGRKHALSDIAIGIPFISNLPVDVEVKVWPAFSAKLNGSPIAMTGETRPFHDTLESSINVKLDALDIPTYLAYSPVRLNFTVPRGSLDTDLRIAFRRAAPASTRQARASRANVGFGRIGRQRVRSGGAGSKRAAADRLEVVARRPRRSRSLRPPGGDRRHRTVSPDRRTHPRRQRCDQLGSVWQAAAARNTEASVCISEARRKRRADAGFSSTVCLHAETRCDQPRHRELLGRLCGQLPGAGRQPRRRSERPDNHVQRARQGSRDRRHRRGPRLAETRRRSRTGTGRRAPCAGGARCQVACGGALSRKCRQRDHRWPKRCRCRRRVRRCRTRHENRSA